jgi:DNA adenine methylase
VIDGLAHPRTLEPLNPRTLAPLNPPLPPPLKWAGGKRWQVPVIAPLWADHLHRRLVEPFCGGLAIALGLSPERALLNDRNLHLVNFYRWLQRGLTIRLRMSNAREDFYRHRNRFNALVAAGESETAEAAALFYYLNRTGYNGLCRFNRKGAFNVPFGRYARIRYTRDFAPYIQALGRWQFSHGDLEQVAIEPDDFIYADPPYDVPFTSYSSNPFTWDDQERTAAWLARHPGPVVLANQATPRIVKLYRRLGFTLRQIDAPRRISCTGDRRPAREVIATRNL